MKQLRNLIPFLAIFALTALFLKLPELPLGNTFGCKVCASSNLYLLLSGTGYFAILLAISLLFPAFPKLEIARGGLVGSSLLAVMLTYMNLPNWCTLCFIGHVCNILIWTIWVIVPSENRVAKWTVQERTYLLMLSPVSMIALFNCFNLTFMAQNVKSHYDGFSQGLKLGDDVPRFSAQAISGLPITTRSNHGRMIINFISSGCPHCKEQLQLLSTLASQLASSPYQFVNVSADLQPELLRYLPFAEWVEDSEGRLRKLFKVSGYPTLFVIESNGKISQVIPGVPEELKDHLESLISNSAR